MLAIADLIVHELDSMLVRHSGWVPTLELAQRLEDVPLLLTLPRSCLLSRDHHTGPGAALPLDIDRVQGRSIISEAPMTRGARSPGFYAPLAAHQALGRLIGPLSAARVRSAFCARLYGDS